MTDDTLRELLVPLTRAGELIVEPVEDGLRVKQVGRHYLDVIRMAFNYRLTETLVASPLVYDRHWCYVGTDQTAFMAAVIGAAMWDGEPDTEPLGWNKSWTGQWREPGEPQTWQTARTPEVLARQYAEYSAQDAREEKGGKPAGKRPDKA